MTPLWRPSPNCDPRTADVDMVVIHYTDMTNAHAAESWLRNPESRVSAHYLIAADGTVVHMVAEDRRAWHAGQSYWRGVRDNNARSIGIELDNPGHSNGHVHPYPSVQIDALVSLLDGIRTRHPIPARNVVGHSDIAPHRKTDPGEHFPWPALAAAGHALSIPKIAAPPAAPPFEADAFAGALTAIGYAPAGRSLSEIFGTVPAAGTRISAPGGPSVPALLPSATNGVLSTALADAFHRRFNPERLGVPANGQSLALALAIAAALGEMVSPREPSAEGPTKLNRPRSGANALD